MLLRTLLLAALLLPLATLASAGPAVDEHLNALCRNIQNGGECATAIERHQLSRGVGGVSRDGDRLTIRTRDGRQVVLVDGGKDPGRPVYYRYIQPLASIGFHLVDASADEWGEMLMVSDADGARYFIPDTPLVSPDRNYVLVVSPKECCGTSGVFLYQVAEGTLQPVFRHDPEEYALYSFVRWRDPRTAQLQKTSHGDGKACAREAMMNTGVLLRREARWRLEPDGSKPRCQ